MNTACSSLLLSLTTFHIELVLPAHAVRKSGTNQMVTLACCSSQRWAGRQHLKMKQDKKEISRNIQGAPELFLRMYLTTFGIVFFFSFFVILLPAIGPGDHSSLAPANQTARSCPRSVLCARAGAEMAIACLASVAAQNQTNCLSLCKQEQDVMGFVQPLTDTCTFHSSYSLSLTSSAWFVSN